MPSIMHNISARVEPVTKAHLNSNPCCSLNTIHPIVRALKSSKHRPYSLDLNAILLTSYRTLLKILYPTCHLPDLHTTPSTCKSASSLRQKTHPSAPSSEPEDESLPTPSSLLTPMKPSGPSYQHPNRV